MIVTTFVLAFGILLVGVAVTTAHRHPLVSLLLSLFYVGLLWTYILMVTPRLNIQRFEDGSFVIRVSGCNPDKVCASTLVSED